MADRYYYLAQWDHADGTGDRQAGYYAPQGTVGLFDMRPGGTTTFGFFAADRRLTADDWWGIDTPELYEMGDGTDLREYYTTQAERDMWRAKLDLTLAEGPDDIRLLRDLLVHTFERWGDPEHAERFKPPTATRAGNIELHLGGHSLISRTPFARLPKAARDRTLAVVQRDMARLLDLCRRVTDKGGFRSMNLDVLVSPDGDALVHEMHPVFGSKNPEQMLIDGEPGRFTWDESTRTWVLEQGRFCQNNCCNLRIHELLAQMGRPLPTSDSPSPARQR